MGAALLTGLATSAAAMDVNRASVKELASLRGLGVKTAKIIVQERERGGPFGSIEALSERVRGIGARKALSLQNAGLKALLPPTPNPAAPRPATPKPAAPKPAVPKPAAPDNRSMPPAPLIGNAARR